MSYESYVKPLWFGVLAIIATGLVRFSYQLVKHRRQYRDLVSRSMLSQTVLCMQFLLAHLLELHILPSQLTATSHALLTVSSGDI